MPFVIETSAYTFIFILFKVIPISIAMNLTNKINLHTIE